MSTSLATLGEVPPSIIEANTSKMVKSFTRNTTTCLVATGVLLCCVGYGLSQGFLSLVACLVLLGILYVVTIFCVLFIFKSVIVDTSVDALIKRSNRIG